MKPELGELYRFIANDPSARADWASARSWPQLLEVIERHARRAGIEIDRDELSAVFFPAEGRLPDEGPESAGVEKESLLTRA